MVRVVRIWNSNAQSGMNEREPISRGHNRNLIKCCVCVGEVIVGKIVRIDGDRLFGDDSSRGLDLLGWFFPWKIQRYISDIKMWFKIITDYSSKLKIFSHTIIMIINQTVYNEKIYESKIYPIFQFSMQRSKLTDMRHLFKWMKSHFGRV